MPRQVDHAARLAAIGDAVLAIAAEQGFGAVTIRAVAEHIGTSTTAATHYVNNRDDLLRTAIGREIADRRAQAEDAVGTAHGAAGLRALIEWAVLEPSAHAHRVWLALVVGAHAEPVLRTELDSFNAWWDQRVHTLLTESGAAGSAAVIDLLDAVADGLVVTAFDEGHPWPPARRKRVLTLLWQTLGL
ncbi:TetR/AcrR family transcriptional regulator [Nocardia sp. GCM10030253]|uniref:TetR/AcrR family transcriptional regulator n=1 Tax=Nocardia sp. GCM10030253 TaxID=3273404 RepID=UPI00362EB50E